MNFTSKSEIIGNDDSRYSCEKSLNDSCYEKPERFCLILFFLS